MSILVLLLLFLFFVPFRFFIRRTRYILMAVTAVVYPLTLYLYHRLCLEKAVLKALSINDLRNIAFNYLTGAFFIAELLIPKKSTKSIRGNADKVEYDRVMIGFAGYRMYMDKTIDDNGTNIGDDRTTGNKHIGQVRYLYVHPSYRRRGLGSTLMRYMYDHASRQQYLGMVASTDEYLVGAAAFLEDNGFRMLDREAPADGMERLLRPRGDIMVFDRPVLAHYESNGQARATARADTRRKKNNLKNKTVDNGEEEEDDDVDFAVDTKNPGLVRRRRQPGQAQKKLRAIDPISLGRDPEADIRNMYEYLDSGNSGITSRRTLGSSSYPVHVGSSGLVGEDDDGIYRGESVTVPGTLYGLAGGRARPGQPLTKEEVLAMAVAGKDKGKTGGVGGGATGRYAISSTEAQDLTDEQLKRFLESLKRE
jgi:GNAT superfamily N-acetyltransferase